jgi:hypothetical protein
MADPQQLDVIRRGAEAWNAWREEHPGLRANLVGADLREARSLQHLLA